MGGVQSRNIADSSQFRLLLLNESGLIGVQLRHLVNIQRRDVWSFNVKDLPDSGKAGTDISHLEKNLLYRELADPIASRSI